MAFEVYETRIADVLMRDKVLRGAVAAVFVPSAAAAILFANAWRLFAMSTAFNHRSAPSLDENRAKG